MEAITQQVLCLAALQLLMCPVIVYLVKRFVGRRMDAYDERRELARKEAEQARQDSRLWRQAMENGMKSLLRAEIVTEYRKATNQGYYDLQSREFLTRVRKAYHDLGGNDVGDKLYSEIMELPTKEQEES